MATLGQKTTEAQKKYNELRRVIGGREVLFWREAELLYELKKTKLYKFVFGIDEHEPVERSWNWFVKEIDIPLSTADYKVRVYEKWIVGLGYTIDNLLNIQTRKLSIAIPYATDREVAKEILIQAQILPFNEFYKWIKEAYGNKPEDMV